MSDTIRQTIRQAMTKRGVTARQLAAEMGLPVSTVYGWRSGDHRPLPRHAATLADLLDWPSLAKLIRDAWTTPCPVCGKARVHGSNAGRYCGRKCQHVAGTRRRRGVAGKPGVLAQHRVKAYERAVDDLCRRWCEPETGVCRDSTCPIQRAGLSPLSLSKRRAVA
jgi:hypothetical protein